MAEPGYVDALSTIPRTEGGNDFLTVEALPLPANVDENYIFRRYPVIVQKAVLIPFVDENIFPAEEVNKRFIAWAGSILTEVKALQATEIFPSGIIRGNYEGQTYDWQTYTLLFENISYRDLVDAAAVLMRHEPKNLFLDEGRTYPGIQAIVPSTDRVKTMQTEAEKLSALRQKAPHLFDRSKEAPLEYQRPQVPGGDATSPAPGGAHRAPAEAPKELDDNWF